MPENKSRKASDLIRDERIIKKIKIFSRYLIPPHSPLRGCTGTDLLQDTLSKAWEKRSDYKGVSEGQFINWLKTIMHNNFMSQFKRRSLLERRLTTGTGDTLAAADTDEALSMMEAIDGLTRVQQAIILLRCEGFTETEIGVKLELSRNQINYQIELARDKLRGRLG